MVLEMTYQFVPIADLSPDPRLSAGTRSYRRMIKVTGSICNLGCTYCYYLHKQKNAVSIWMGEGAQRCVHHELGGPVEAVEHNGSVYFWDHYVYPEYKLGDILRIWSSRMEFSEQQRKFGFAKTRKFTAAMSRLPVSVRLQRRMPQEPPHPNS